MTTGQLLPKVKLAMVARSSDFQEHFFIFDIGMLKTQQFEMKLVEAAGALCLPHGPPPSCSCWDLLGLDVQTFPSSAWHKLAKPSLQ